MLIDMQNSQLPFVSNFRDFSPSFLFSPVPIRRRLPLHFAGRGDKVRNVEQFVPATTSNFGRTAAGEGAQINYSRALKRVRDEIENRPRAGASTASNCAMSTPSRSCTAALPAVGSTESEKMK